MRACVCGLLVLALLAVSPLRAAAEEGGHGHDDHGHDDHGHDDHGHDDHGDEEEPKVPVKGAVWPWDGLFLLESSNSYVWWTEPYPVDVAFFKLQPESSARSLNLSDPGEVQAYVDEKRAILASDGSSAATLLALSQSGNANSSSEALQVTSITDSATVRNSVFLMPNSAVLHRVSFNYCQESCSMILEIPEGEGGLYYVAGNYSDMDGAPFDLFLSSRSGKVNALPWTREEPGEMEKMPISPEIWGNAFAGVLVGVVMASFLKDILVLRGSRSSYLLTSLHPKSLPTCQRLWLECSLPHPQPFLSALSNLP
jgi:hypothetical protein